MGIYVYLFERKSPKSRSVSVKHLILSLKPSVRIKPIYLVFAGKGIIRSENSQQANSICKHLPLNKLSWLHKLYTYPQYISKANLKLSLFFVYSSPIFVLLNRSHRQLQLY
jgi:hypothetical protein